MDANLVAILTTLNLGSPEFFQFMQDKIQVIDNIDPNWYGVFPMVSAEGILQDLRMLVPSVDLTKKRTILINVHEFTHAYELFQELGRPYEDKRIERESRAKLKEEEYLNNQQLILKK